MAHGENGTGGIVAAIIASIAGLVTAAGAIFTRRSGQRKQHDISAARILEGQVKRLDARLDECNAKHDDCRRENADLRECLGGLESRVKTLEDGRKGGDRET